MEDMVTHRKYTADLSFVEIFQANRTIVGGRGCGFVRGRVLEGWDVVLYVVEREGGGSARWRWAEAEALTAAVEKWTGEEEEDGGKTKEEEE